MTRKLGETWKLDTRAWPLLVQEREQGFVVALVRCSNHGVTHLPEAQAVANAKLLTQAPALASVLSRLMVRLSGMGCPEGWEDEDAKVYQEALEVLCAAGINPYEDFKEDENG